MRILVITISDVRMIDNMRCVTITREDVDTLRDDWLTDNVIAFWQEFLERELLSQHSNAKIILLRPSMAFLLMQTQDSQIEVAASALPSFDGVTHIFLPINDCSNASVAEGGSHWSLLLVSAVDGVAFHYDSMNSANGLEAEHATRKMARILKKELRFLDLEDSPQQANSSDCGVFVCLTMKHLLLNRLLTTSKHQQAPMSMGGRTVNAASGRKEILRVIENFRREGERRRSRSASPYNQTPRVE